MATKTKQIHKKTRPAISSSDWLEILRDIGLALHACNNCVTTDKVGIKIKPGEGYWRIDNSKEIALVNMLEERFKDTCTCPECGHCSTRRVNPEHGATH